MTTWAGIDVAKNTHWICAMDGDGRILLGHAVRNTQAELDALSAELRALPGPVTVGLDVDGSIAAFLQAVLLADSLALVHVPGLAVNRAAHGYAGGERRSDPQDARVIADLVRTREGLRPIRPDDDATASLRLLVGRRRDLVQDQNRRFSRLRQLLSQAHPGLEAALDVTCKGPLVLLTRYVTPAEIRAASEKAIHRPPSPPHAQPAQPRGARRHRPGLRRRAAHRRAGRGDGRPSGARGRRRRPPRPRAFGRPGQGAGGPGRRPP